MKIEFCTNFDGFQLADTMVFDNLYEIQLSMSLADKRYLFEAPSLIMLYMKVNGQLVGEVYGMIPDDISNDGEEIIPEERIHQWNGMYCYSITILPQFRFGQTGIRLSDILKTMWIDLVKNAGYNSIVGHATSTSAARINASLGATFFPQHNIPNIFGSQRLGQYYEIQL